MTNFLTCRVLEIDAAHRVPDHGSGCRHIHGHRYKIEAYVDGKLADSGEANGMTIDFKFLKQVMIDFIHDPCDHGLIMKHDDPLLRQLRPAIGLLPDPAEQAIFNGHAYSDQRLSGAGLKFYITPFTPTAENLARHWYKIMFNPIFDEGGGRVFLSRIRVWETPNCFAEFPAPSKVL